MLRIFNCSVLHLYVDEIRVYSLIGHKSNIVVRGFKTHSLLSVF